MSPHFVGHILPSLSCIFICHSVAVFIPRQAFDSTVVVLVIINICATSALSMRGQHSPDLDTDQHFLWYIAFIKVR